MATALTACVDVALAVSGAQAAATPGWRVVATYPAGECHDGCGRLRRRKRLGGGHQRQLLRPVREPLERQEVGDDRPQYPGSFTDQVTGASVAAIPDGRAMILVQITDEETGPQGDVAIEWRGRSWSEVEPLTRPTPSPLVLTTPGVSTAGLRRLTTSTGQAGRRSRPR